MAALRRSLLPALLLLLLAAAAWGPPPATGELVNRLQEAAPYHLGEAQVFPPPFEPEWRTVNHPGKCQSCHPRIFADWNGSMMSNSWRDPAWRGAFLLVARLLSTHGDCDVPEPPDGTPRMRLNPFADGDACSSTFDLGTVNQTLSRPGSLLDGFCSRCHMPTNYVDNVPLSGVSIDGATGLEEGLVDPRFNPTSDNGTGIAFAELDGQYRNTASGKQGISCAVCHSMAESRATPFGNYRAAEPGGYPPALGPEPRSSLLPPALLDVRRPPAAEAPSLGYAVGAGSFRLSPHALGRGERFGPMAARPADQGSGEMPYLSSVFQQEVKEPLGKFVEHKGSRNVYLERAEMCAACHDVTNPLPLRNPLGYWVGGFPIERTYSEWAHSRYADRPGNRNFDAAFKRDCQTCHMQQDFGQPGTAQTLHRDGRPLAPLTGPVATDAPAGRVYFSHHFIGGNAYVPGLIGAAVDEFGEPRPYPRLSVFSFSSQDESSPYHNAYWSGVSADARQASPHARLAWDRLRNVLELELEAPERAAAGEAVQLRVAVSNNGSGHKFPTGFPEGRDAWLAVRAFDLGSGRELDIHDSRWRRRSKGIGYLSRRSQPDPNFPDCDDWKLPPGTGDPYAYHFKAVATLGDGCPTLDLPLAAAPNLVVDRKGLPVDETGRRIDRDNPRGLARFRDLDGDGDLYDDAFLLDSRLRPLPHEGATVSLERYSVEVPADAVGPIAVTAAVYYQSLEAKVAMKFLGNLADRDGDFVLEPCTLGGPCDGRLPHSEPAVVEGSPPVPMEVRTRLIELRGAPARTAVPQLRSYPPAGADRVYRDVVVKVFASEPLAGIDAGSFTLEDDAGQPVAAFVDQIGDGVWGLFPHPVHLDRGRTYTATVSGPICGVAGGCRTEPLTWSFTIAERFAEEQGDTSVPVGFPLGRPAPPDPAPHLLSAACTGTGGAFELAFSEEVLNLGRRTVQVLRGGASDDPCVAAKERLAGTLEAAVSGSRWTFTPQVGTTGARFCVRLDGEIFDLSGQLLGKPAEVPIGPCG